MYSIRKRDRNEIESFCNGGGIKAVGLEGRIRGKTEVRRGRGDTGSVAQL